MNPKLKIPVSSKTANQVLLCSCQVFSSAPIHATSRVISPPIIAPAPTMPRPIRIHASALPRIPTMSVPAIKNTLVASAINTAAMATTAPVPKPIRLPMKSLVTVALLMVVSFRCVEWVLEFSRGRGSHGDDDRAPGVTRSDVSDRGGRLGDWIPPVDQGGELA